MLRTPLSFAIVLSALTLLSGCASTTLVNSWTDPTYKAGGISRVLVMAIVSDPIVRRSLEDEFASRLREKGIEAVSSYTVIPEEGKVEKDRMKQAVRKSGANALLLSRLVKVDQGTQYVPGYSTASPSLGYGRGFYDYYSYSWTYMPPRVYQYSVYTVETNLWEAADEKLVWAGTTETFDPGDVQKEIKAFTKLIMDALGKDNLI